MFYLVFWWYKKLVNSRRKPSVYISDKAKQSLPYHLEVVWSLWVEHPEVHPWGWLSEGKSQEWTSISETEEKTDAQVGVGNIMSFFRCWNLLCVYHVLHRQQQTHCGGRQTLKWSMLFFPSGIHTFPQLPIPPRPHTPPRVWVGSVSCFWLTEWGKCNRMYINTFRDYITKYLNICLAERLSVCPVIFVKPAGML